jgi:hypothetical protein
MGDHLEVVKWAIQNGYKWNYYTCEGAYYYGHKEVLKWMKINGYKCGGIYYTD